MIFDSIKTYLIIAAVALITGGYFAYHFTSEYYIAKIEAANTKAEEKVNEIQRAGDQSVADYVKRIKQLNEQVLGYEHQKSAALNGTTCSLSVGFVRLYNASAAGETTSPDSFDGTPANVDAATLLDVLIENNVKYNQVADQLIKLQKFNE